MNYYPYGGLPYLTMPARNVGLFGRILGGINFKSILSGTQKTLGFINQTIPTIKQITPVFKNAKTMFKVMNEFKKVDTNKVSINKLPKEQEKKEINEEIVSDQGPTFFA